MTKGYDKELEELEKQQKELRQRQSADDRDRYNTIEDRVSKHDYMRVINAKVKIAPQSSETLEHYIQKLEIHRDISFTKNWDTHVDNPYKTWHTHKQPSCFMCEDQIFIGILIQVLQVINKQHPKIIF